MLLFKVKFGIGINVDTDDVAEDMPPIEEDEDAVAIEKEEDDDSPNVLDGDGGQAEMSRLIYYISIAVLLRIHCCSSLQQPTYQWVASSPKDKLLAVTGM